MVKVFATELFVLFSSLPFMLAMFILLTFNVIVDMLNLGYHFISFLFVYYVSYSYFPFLTF